MNKKITLAAGIALLTLTVLLTIVYAAISGVFVSADHVPPSDVSESYAEEAILKICELLSCLICLHFRLPPFSRLSVSRIRQSFPFWAQR